MVVGCLSNTISRNQLVSFTPDFFYEHYSVIYSSRGYKHNSTVSIVRPFTIDMWIILVFLIAVVAMLIKKFNKSSTRHAFNFFDFIEVLVLMFA